MRLGNIFWVILALAVSATAAHIFFKAGDIDPVEQERIEYQAQIDQAIKRAGKGDARSLQRVGYLFRLAPAGLRDYPKALKWYKKAADKGSPRSQYVLGKMYAEGQGVKQNYYRAAQWFRLASSFTGLADAQFALGELYFYGRGVPSNYGHAIELYEKAANQGHVVAQFFLGKINQEGWGIDKNMIEAYKWISLSIRGKEKVRAHNPANSPEKVLSSLKAEMNRSQIRAGERALKVWKPSR